jgi:arylsulfatase A-like enzyme
MVDRKSELTMKRETKLGMIVALAVTAMAGTLQAERQPNIVYVMADDLGYGDLGCYGQKTVRTPNIDRLAREGMRFTDHYSGHTVCRPSRLVLLTGRHSGHTPIDANVDYWLKPGERTVTSLLKKAGYATGGVGKWALGEPGTTGVPLQQRFDFWFGYLDQGRAHNYYPEYLWKNGAKFPLAGNVEGPQRAVSIERRTYSHDVITEQALGFIRANARRPFFLQAHYTIPHTNNGRGKVSGNGMEVPDYGDYADRKWPVSEKGFAAMIGRLDRDIGQIIAQLRQLEIERDTVVFFTSDNGPHQEGGHKVDYFDSNGPLRGFKRDLYEGGIRVPMIAWWPGRIKAGSATKHPSAFWDFLPTACELAGIESPTDIDGISYLPTLLGHKQRQHDFLYWQYREKDAVRQGQWKAVRTRLAEPLELYDLNADICEHNNVAASNPAVVERLESVIAKVRQED